MTTQQTALLGKRLAPGLAVGPAWVISNSSSIQGQYNKSDIETEKNIFLSAVADVDKDLQAIIEQSDSSDQTEIIQAHRLLLQDPEWQEQIIAKIDNGEGSVAAVDSTTQDFAEMMAGLEDPYLRERSHDIRDIGGRVSRKILKQEEQILMPDQGEYIVVARDMTPSQFASLDKKRLLGLVTEQGGVTSHIAIMARLYEIPTLSGIENIDKRIKNEDWLFLHADKSDLYINPIDADKIKFSSYVEKYKNEKLALNELKQLPAISLDGTRVQLEANIGHESDLQLVEKYNAEGIGLFRTEFLFFDRSSAPTEEEQQSAYINVAKAVAPHPAVIRTFDIGADKQVPYIKWPQEENPFLGLRALRYCLKEPALFQTQLRALLRASAELPLWIMFPMVSSLDELLEAKEHLVKCEKELVEAGICPNYKLGIMIEVPSAALIADQLAAHVDFFSIGTNDLIQYVCAVDRMNETVAHLYESFHPGVLNLIAQVIAAGKRHNVEVAMCGEMAADLDLIPLLFGMGLRIFSQSPATVLRSKKLIRKLKLSECEELWENVKNIGTAKDIQKKCLDFSQNHKD